MKRSYALEQARRQHVHRLACGCVHHPCGTTSHLCTEARRQLAGIGGAYRSGAAGRFEALLSAYLRHRAGVQRVPALGGE